MHLRGMQSFCTTKKEAPQRAERGNICNIFGKLFYVLTVPNQTQQPHGTGGLGPGIKDAGDGATTGASR